MTIIRFPRLTLFAAIVLALVLGYPALVEGQDRDPAPPDDRAWVGVELARLTDVVEGSPCYTMTGNNVSTYADNVLAIWGTDSGTRYFPGFEAIEGDSFEKLFTAGGGDVAVFAFHLDDPTQTTSAEAFLTCDDPPPTTTTVPPTTTTEPPPTTSTTTPPPTTSTPPPVEECPPDALACTGPSPVTEKLFLWGAFVFALGVLAVHMARHQDRLEGNRLRGY